MSPSSVNLVTKSFLDFTLYVNLKKNTKHRMQIGSGTREVNVENIVGDVDDQSLREDLENFENTF